MNEAIFISLVYVSMLFSDIVKDIDLRYIIGYLFIGIVCLNLLANFGTIIFKLIREIRQSIPQLKTRLYKFCRKRKND